MCASVCGVWETLAVVVLWVINPASAEGPGQLLLAAHTSAISLHQVDEPGDEVVNQRRGAPADLIAQCVEKVQQVAIGVLLLTLVTGRLSGWTAAPVGGVSVHTSSCSCSMDTGAPWGDRRPPRKCG